jgi:3-hydroxyacyl-CoA dehydrogenase
LVNTRINQVAVIGASYGAGIAAHLANAGIPVLLLDVVPFLARWRRGRAARNVVVQRGYDKMASGSPPQLARADRAELITLGTLDDDSAKLADCDWIIDAMVQPMVFNLLPLWMQNLGQIFFFLMAWMRPNRKPPQSAPNRSLMDRIEAARSASCIVSSTTGAPVHQIVEGRSAAFRRHFLGVQFSTPARYVKLLEMTPTADTAPEVVEFMVAFCRERLGKGVVFSKDTPFYINNRMLTMTNAYGVESALDQGCSVEEVDALTGPLIGRPEFATFQLMDTVGIDVLAFLSTSLYPAIADDPYRPVLNGKKFAKVRNRMLRNGWLGRKSGRTFYLTRTVKGQSEIEAVLDPATFHYAPPQAVHLASVDAASPIEDLGERLRALLAQDDRGAAYVRGLLDFNMAYAATVAPAIAGNPADIDAAMHWGFDHDAGPFQIWDMLGVAETTARMQAAGWQAPAWHFLPKRRGLRLHRQELSPAACRPADFARGGFAQGW